MSKDNKGTELDTPKGPSTPLARWFYASGKSWVDFHSQDQKALEERWKELGGDEWGRERRKRADKRREERQRKKEEEAKQQGRDLEKEAAQKQQAEDAKKKNPVPPSAFEAVRNTVADMLPSTSSPASAITSGAVTPASAPGVAKAIAEDEKEQEKVIVREILDPDTPAEERKSIVAALEDKLFDCDLESMTVYPVFWKGVKLRVVRAIWFYSSATDGGYAPIAYDEDLSRELEEAYAVVKPWNRLAGKEAEPTDDKPGEASKPDDELYELPSMEDKGSVHFESPVAGRIYTKNFTGRLLSVLGGSLAVRGFEEAERLAKLKAGGPLRLPDFSLPFAGGSDPDSDSDEDAVDDSDDDSDDEGYRPKRNSDRHGAHRASRKEGAATRPKRPQAEGGEGKEAQPSQGFIGKLWPSSDWRPEIPFLRSLGWSKGGAEEEAKRGQRQRNTEQAADTGRKDEDDSEVSEDEDGEIPDDRADEPPELVLCIHGIGQGLVESFEALDFVYDVERLRKESKKHQSEPGIRRISRGQRAQFLPVCWRQGLSFDYRPEHNDNFYSLTDVDNAAAIPVVRNVISKVVLDVPYYLSHHKEKMIDAVKTETNRIYRLWCARNPEFVKRGGRVSLICHSLGSALATDILSNQPTTVPALADLSEEERVSNKHLVFNVKNLFLIGSPCGFFFYLSGGQLIARRGTARTAPGAFPDDATSDAVGRYGCLAAESVYNIYNTTDPVAYQLSATVDKQYAGLMRPVSVPVAVQSLLEALSMPRLSISKLFNPAKPFSSGSEATTKAADETGPDSKYRGRKRAARRQASMVVEEGETLKKSQVHAKAKEKAKEQKEPVDLKKLERAERRFRALNPHGAVDFFFESNGFNEYFDMLSAHISYWTSPSFSTFVLSQVFTDYSSNSTAEEPAPTLVPTLDVLERVTQKPGQGSKESAEGSEEPDKTRRSYQWEGLARG